MSGLLLLYMSVPDLHTFFIERNLEQDECTEIGSAAEVNILDSGRFKAAGESIAQ